jgi:3-oxoacyl-[acyl-carrier-protein] synthase II
MSRRRAVITGIGPITCIGTGVDRFWDGILAENSGIGSITSFDPSVFHVRCAGEIRDWNAEDYFSPHRLKRLDRYAQFAVVSAKLALEDARIDYSREKPQDRVGVSFGTALGGVCKAEEQYIRYLKKGARGTTNSNSCASGTVSVGEALRYIRDDFADVVVAGGAEAPLTAITIGAFDIIKTMSRWPGEPSLACRPFDALRDGFVMGEGGASLVMEELEHALARGAHIYAEVLGYSLNNDAFHMTSPLPSGESCIRAMREALADAQLAREQIDYINAHASSTQLNDSAETASVKQVFGDHARRIPVSGTKGYYAHPLGATGAIEAALCALSLDRQWIPPTINYQNPDPACDLDVVPNQGRPAELNYVMSNSFGFGGINACVVLGKAH